MILFDMDLDGGVDLPWEFYWQGPAVFDDCSDWRKLSPKPSIHKDVKVTLLHRVDRAMDL